jgi:hypothetical protein
MALSAAVVLEVRNGGSDTNGGGFKTGATGTDWSLQNAAQYSVTDGVTAGTTTITSATAAFGTDVVGNLIYVQGGTGSVVAGWYEITARGSATSITVDRSTGLTAGTGVTLKIGGALASPGQAGAIATVAGMKTFIKYNATPYTVTSASTNIAAGCVSATADTAWCGYDTTRSLYNTDANRPTIKLNAGVTSATIFTNVNAHYLLQSVILDANAQTGSRCAQMSGEYFYVKGMNGVTAGLSQNSATGRAILCEVTGCAATPINIISMLWCVSHDNTLSSPTNAGAFQGQDGGTIYGCLAYNNNCDGFVAPGGGKASFANCTAYGNGGAGFNTQNGYANLINCIAETNTTYGYRVNAGLINMINCASYSNTSGRFQNAGSGTQWSDTGSITGSGSFFTNAAGSDFTLNNTAGAGAVCRSVGFPTAFPVPAMNNYADLGPVRHQDPAGGGGGRIIGG